MPRLIADMDAADYLAWKVREEMLSGDHLEPPSEKELSDKFRKIILERPLAASPGPSELVEEMERLEVKYRAQCKILATGEPDFSDGIAAGKQECADDLRALITRHRGKS